MIEGENSFRVEPVKPPEKVPQISKKQGQGDQGGKDSKEPGKTFQEFLEEAERKLEEQKKQSR